MTAARPTIVFVVIAYNEAARIGACIRSIQAQTGVDVDAQIIVIDDASTDRTATVASAEGVGRWPIRIERLPLNSGRGAARARGVELALLDECDYVAMVDADIILPNDWLEACLRALKDRSLDAVGGTAVPDGDVAWISRALGLSARPTPATTTITGNNGLYKAVVFEELNFDAKLREGEDVALNHELRAFGHSVQSLPGVRVQHVEQKNYLKSAIWLFQSGVGATRQLLRYRQLRAPDIATLAFWGSVVVAMTARGKRSARLRPLPFAVTFGITLLHLVPRFDFRRDGALKALLACASYAPLILCYFIGRAVGLARAAAWVQSGGRSGGDSVDNVAIKGLD